MNKQTIVDQLDYLMERLAVEDPSGEEYKEIVARVNDLLSALGKVEALERESSQTWLDKLVAAAPLISAGSSLGLGLAVLYHERINVITSKAWSLVRFK